MCFLVQGGPLLGMNGVITPLYGLKNMGTGFRTLLISGDVGAHLGAGHVQQNSQEVSFLTYGNAIFILIFLRTVVPRLLVFLGAENENGGMKLLGVGMKPWVA